MIREQQTTDRVDSARGSDPGITHLDRLPIVLGVTGHRDLRPEDRAGLESQVAAIFAGYRDQYPETPLALISPLAAGADQLVARVAVRLGVRLIAPLPLDQADYERDFSDPESLRDFRELFEQADPGFALAPPTVGQDGSREGAYARVGAFVASHCQVLIALWDGRDTGREGGTGQIVGFKLQGVPPCFVPANSPLDIPEAGPVDQVVTPRTNQPILANALGRVVHYPGKDPGMAVVFERIFALMNGYNRDALALDRPLAEARAKSRSYLLSQIEVEGLDRSLKADLGRYAVADSLAQHFQAKSYRALVGLIGIVFVLALFFQAHVVLRQVYKLDAPGPRPWYASTLFIVDRGTRTYLTTLDAVYLGVLGLAFALFQRERRANHQNKHQDYRAIAEGLRVQFFWRLAGLSDSVADHYLRKQKGELEWIRNAVRIGVILGGPTPTDNPESRMALVTERWVEDQGRFFTRRAARAVQQSRWIRSLGQGSFYAGLAFLVIRAFGPPDHPLIVGLVLVLAVSLLINVYARVTALSEHAKQYTRMTTLFAHASRQLATLAASVKVEEARALLMDLGKESLAENGEWVLLHRDRPLELPRV